MTARDRRLFLSEICGHRICQYLWSNQDTSHSKINRAIIVVSREREREGERAGASTLNAIYCIYIAEEQYDFLFA